MTGRSGLSSRSLSSWPSRLTASKALAPKHPEWKTEEPYASLLRGDLKGALGRRRAGYFQNHRSDARGHYHRRVRIRLSPIGSQPRSIRRPSVSIPRWRISRCSNCSRTCARTASRRSLFPVAVSNSCAPLRRSSYGIPPEQVVGSSGRLKFVLRDGTPTLMKLPELSFLNDKGGKPISIQTLIGRRPIAAFGNSDGDLQMLQWTTAGSGARFALIVHHTDAVREWAYDRKAGLGRLDKALDEAQAKGWTVVNMKDDWNHIFPFENE